MAALGAVVALLVVVGAVAAVKLTKLCSTYVGCRTNFPLLVLRFTATLTKNGVLELNGRD